MTPHATRPHILRTGRNIGLDVVVITNHALDQTAKRWDLPFPAAWDFLSCCLSRGKIVFRAPRQTYIRYKDATAVLVGKKVVTVVKEATVASS